MLLLVTIELRPAFIPNILQLIEISPPGRSFWSGSRWPWFFKLHELPETLSPTLRDLIVRYGRSLTL